MILRLAFKDIRHDWLLSICLVLAIASIIAPLLVPVLMGVGGMVLLFGVFGVAFLVGAVASLALPEHKGLALES